MVVGMVKEGNVEHFFCFIHMHVQALYLKLRDVASYCGVYNQYIFFFSCKNSQFKRSKRSTPLQTQKCAGNAGLYDTRQSPERPCASAHRLQPLHGPPGLLESKHQTLCKTLSFK